MTYSIRIPYTLRRLNDLTDSQIYGLPYSPTFDPAVDDVDFPANTGLEFDDLNEEYVLGLAGLTQWMPCFFGKVEAAKAVEPSLADWAGINRCLHDVPNVVTAQIAALRCCLTIRDKLGAYQPLLERTRLQIINGSDLPTAQRLLRGLI